MKRLTRLLAVGALCVFPLLASTAWAERVVADNVRTQYEMIRVVEVAAGLEHPWALAFLPDGSLLVTERPGRLQWVRDGEKHEIGGLPGNLHATGQGGLLDLALHPDFDDNRWVYFTYSRGDRRATTTALARARLDTEARRLRDLEQLLVADAEASPGRHYGSRVAFLPDGTLLMTVGDRGDNEHTGHDARAQNVGNHVGTTIRLHDDGSVPGDNPFVDDPGARDEIFSYGHRNAQGMFIHPETGEIWQSEHGPRGGDELNRVRPGVNYGWPVVSHGRDYRTQRQIGVGRYAEGMEPPVRDWTPSIAPSGLAHYGGGAFERWQGNFFAGALSRPAVRRLVVEDGKVTHEEELLRDTLGRIRDVREGPDGLLYLLTDARNGGIYRVEPAN